MHYSIVTSLFFQLELFKEYFGLHNEINRNNFYVKGRLYFIFYSVFFIDYRIIFQFII